MIAIALSLLAAVGFGSAPVFTRTALQGFSFLPAVWMSLIVSFFLALALAVLLARQDIGNLTLTAFLWILAVGVTHHVCGRPQNYFSVSIIGASRASLFFSSQAPVAAFVAVVFLGESLSTPIILGTAAVVAGLIAGSGDSLLEGWRADRRYLLGYLVALSAGTVYGMVNIFVKKANESVDSPLLVTSISLLLGISLLAPLVAPRTVKEVRNTSDLRRTLVFVVLAGLAAGVGVNSLYFALLTGDVVIVTPIVSIAPLVTVLIAHLFYARQENVTPRLAGGTALAVAGVVLVSLARWI